MHLSRFFLNFTLASLTAVTHAEVMHLTYRGPWGFDVLMTMRQDAGQYQLHTTMKLPFYRMEFLSQGEKKNGQYLTRHFIDKRNGRPYAKVEVNTQGIYYGKAEETAKFKAGDYQVLDLFNLAWQLAASDGAIQPNILITNGKNLYPVSAVTTLTNETFSLQNQKFVMKNLEVQRNHQIIRYGYLPEFHHLPAHIEFNEKNSHYKMVLKSVRFE